MHRYTIGMIQSDPLAIATDLLRFPSVTPDDAGCHQYIIKLLQQQGFTSEQFRFDDVDNLWAVRERSSGGPLVIFAGHTDVVPPGDLAKWQHPPFTPTLADGKLYARGAADMKGSIAAFLAALPQIDQPVGTLGVLLTSDEEGVAVNGTVKVVEVLQQRGIRADSVIIGEPSSQHRLGDCVRIGRRGSLSAEITLTGKGGHVAYPQHLRNPVHLAAAAISTLANYQWDNGSDLFPPTSLQFTRMQCDSGATNVSPTTLQLRCNLRFNPLSKVEYIQQLFAQTLEATGLECTINWRLSAMPFLSRSGRLREITRQVIYRHCNIEPDFSTGGGTSDGRFLIALTDQLIELGPVNATIHQINEHVALDDLRTLSGIYQDLCSQLFK